jgi:hypothetical protein
MKLTLGQTTAAVSSEKEVRERQPVTYHVNGLPPWESAIIARSVQGRWRYLRTTKTPSPPWSTEFDSAEEALRYLAAEIEG